MNKISEFFHLAKFTKDEKLLYKDLKKKYKSKETMSRLELLELSCFESRKSIKRSLFSIAISLFSILISISVILIKSLA